MNRLRRWMVLGAWLVATAIMATAAPAADDDEALAKALEAVVVFELGADQAPLAVVEGRVRAALGDPAKRRALAAKLTACFEEEKVTAYAKRFVCRQLALVGGQESVPALAALLEDEEFTHMARYALERIEDPAAGAALLEALEEARGGMRLGLINSLGERRRPEAVPALIEVLEGPDVEAACAAAEALGKIGGEKAEVALARAGDRRNAKLRLAAADARLKCAAAFVAAGKTDRALAIYRALSVPGTPLAVVTSAWAGLVRHDDDGLAMVAVVETLRRGHPGLAGPAAAFTRDRFPGPDVTRRLTELAADLPPARRVHLVRALGGRGDRLARPAALAAAQSDDDRLRIAGYGALGALGNAKDVPLLSETAADHEAKSEIGRVTRLSLARLDDPETDAALVTALPGARSSLAIVLIGAIRARRSAGAVEPLFKVAGHEDKKVRKAALGALGTLAGPGDLDRFTAVVARAPKKDENTARSALATACRRLDDKEARARPVLAALDGASPAVKFKLLRVLARIGGDAALAAVRADLTGEDAKTREAAVRAISDWVDVTPLEDTLRIGRESDVEKLRVLALRGYDRMLRIQSDREQVETVALYVAGLEACRRVQDKKMMIGGLGRLECVDAMKAVAPFVGDKELSKEAEAALVRVAGNLQRSRKRGDKIRAIGLLEDRIDAFTNKKSKKRAQKVLRVLQDATRGEE